MKVVLVSGKARHGKDTVAQLLYEELQFNGCKVLITHFADVLKYVCKNFLGWNGKKDEYGKMEPISVVIENPEPKPKKS